MGHTREASAFGGAAATLAGAGVSALSLGTLRWSTLCAACARFRLTPAAAFCAPPRSYRNTVPASFSKVDGPDNSLENALSVHCTGPNATA